MGAVIVRLEGLRTGRGGEALSPPLDLSLSGGEALVVTGPNGAGKSTLLRTLADLLPPFSGRMRIEGAAAPDGERARTIGEAAHYLGTRNALKGGVSLFENLRFWQAFLGGRGRGGAAVSQALAAYDLAELGALAVSHLSAGQQRRAALARLLVAPRPVWLLDEPTNALDAAARGRFAQIAKDHLAQGGIVVVATHQPLGFGDRRLELGRAAAELPS